MLLIDKFKDSPEKALFFVHQTVENGWSRKMLLNFMGTDLYERQGHALTNFKQTLPEETSDLAQELTKDPTSNLIENKEVSDLLSQNVIAKSLNKKRFTPYAFTPFGVSMLSSVLRSKIAIQRNIIIMRAFVLFSEMVTNPIPDSNSELRAEINDEKGGGKAKKGTRITAGSHQ